MTIKTNLEGKGNTNAEIHMKDIQQNLLTIEYVSRTLLAQQSKASKAEIKKALEKDAKEKSEMNQL